MVVDRYMQNKDMMWWSVEERLPEDGDYLVTKIDGEVTAANYQRCSNTWSDIVENYSEYEVLYWMEYPKPHDVKEDIKRIEHEIVMSVFKALKRSEEIKRKVDTVRISWRYAEVFPSVRAGEKAKMFGLDVEFGWLDSNVAFQLYNKKDEDEKVLDTIRKTQYLRTITFYCTDDLEKTDTKRPTILDEYMKAKHMKYFDG